MRTFAPFLVSIAVAACTKSREPAPTADASPAPAAPSSSSSAPQRRNALVRLDGRDLATAHDELALAADDTVKHLFVADDGSAFVVAGASRRCTVRWRVATGAWQTGFEGANCFEPAFFGRSASEVYLALDDGLHRFDGEGWEQVRGERITAIGGPPAPASDLYVLDSHGNTLVRRAGAWKVESVAGLAPRPREFATQAAPMLWAVGVRQGDSGATFDLLFVRAKEDAWLPRPLPVNAIDHRTIWASPDGDVYVSRTGELLRSTDDGRTWQRNPKLEPSVMWGRSNTDVYAGNWDGIHHFDGKTWTKTAFTHGVRALAGNATSVYVVDER